MSKAFKRLMHVRERIDLSQEDNTTRLAWNMIKDSGYISINSHALSRNSAHHLMLTWDGKIEYKDNILRIITKEEETHPLLAVSPTLSRLIKLKIIPVVRHEDKIYLATTNAIRTLGSSYKIIIRMPKEHVDKIRRLVYV